MADHVEILVSDDLYSAAAAEGALEGRSPEQQFAYWARVGRRLTAHRTETRRRVEQAIAGGLPWAELSSAEAAVANAHLDFVIADSAERTSLGEEPAVPDVVSVAIDADGRIHQIRSGRKP